MASKNYKPGEEAEKDLQLYVKDESGKTLGEISVQAGNRVPPTRIKGASYYSTKK